MPSEFDIERLSTDEAELVNLHLIRHLAESGTYGTHWLPYDPLSLPSPPRVGVKALTLSYDEPGWQRWFVLKDSEEVVGHLSLKGSRFNRTLHRSELAMGLERPYIGRGYGTNMLELAIEEVRQVPSIDWLDLRVLGCNTPAHKMYLSMGFTEVSRIDDFCRIDGEPITDIFMSLNVAKKKNS